MAGENAFVGYWRVYGGVTSVARSSYFWLALLLTLTLPKLWQTMGAAGAPPPWVGLTMDIVPSLLGFALGGMAIMLAFSSGKFLEAIRQKGKDASYLRKIMASFFHFSLVLSIALVIAFVSAFYKHPALSFVGVFCALYGVLLILATASRIWHTARIFNAVSDNDKPS